MLGIGKYLAPHANVLSAVLGTQVESIEGFILFMRNGTDAHALAVDMVFHNGSDGTKEGQVGLNNVMHPNGKFILTQMQESYSMSMTKPALEQKCLHDNKRVL